MVRKLICERNQSFAEHRTTTLPMAFRGFPICDNVGNAGNDGGLTILSTRRMNISALLGCSLPAGVVKTNSEIQVKGKLENSLLP